MGDIKCKRSTHVRPYTCVINIQNQIKLLFFSSSTDIRSSLPLGSDAKLLAKPERKINQLMITFQFLPRLTDIECWPKDKIFNFIFHRRKQTAFDFESETMCRAHSPAWLFGFSVKWIYFYVTAKSVTWRNYLTLSSTSSLVLRDETRIYFDMEDIKRAMKQTTMATS